MKSKSETPSKLIQTTVSPALWQQVKRAADREGFTIALWVRRLVIHAVDAGKREGKR